MGWVTHSASASVTSTDIIGTSKDKIEEKRNIEEEKLFFLLSGAHGIVLDNKCDSQKANRNAWRQFIH